MRVAVHDYAGHPFPVQLSRELARRGHQVLHLHCPSDVTGKGALQRRDGDPPTFDVAGVPHGEGFAKYSPAKRLVHELTYTRRLLKRIRPFRPDVVLIANTPLFAAASLVRNLGRAKIPAVLWQQDILSVALSRHFEERMPPLGGLLRIGFDRIERRLFRRAAGVVAISEDFVPTLARWGVPDDRRNVIENWAPLDELPLRSKDNSWAREQGLLGKTVVLYSGTLGLKHNPDLLLQAALRLQDRQDVRIVVVSEGLGAEWLDSRRPENLLVLPYQRYDRLPDVLGSADVLTAILEPAAGAFSVPSKVLTYHCAARPLVAALPPENLAARIIQRADSGLVRDPADIEGFIEALQRLLDDGELRARLGRNARDYAERTFDIDAIGDRFEGVLSAATRRGSPGP
jgi:colanic acid biosynthesis glycosyl transferase WcaI